MGNIGILKEVKKKYPSDIHPQALFTDLNNTYNFPGLFYIDIYPFGEPMVLITNPDVARQVQTSPDVDRHPVFKEVLKGLVGDHGLFSTYGEEWRQQRALFGPAFAMSNLLSLIPGMIEETLIFIDLLTKKAVSGETFSMYQQVAGVTLDAIGRSTINLRLRTQTEHSEIGDAFTKGLKWAPSGATDPWWKILFGKYYLQYYTNKLDKLLGKVIREHFKNAGKGGSEKSMLDLALKGYLNEKGTTYKGSLAGIHEDKEFMTMALDKYVIVPPPAYANYYHSSDHTLPNT